MEENKVAQMTKHTDSSHLTDSGVSGNAQTNAREIRFPSPPYYVSAECKLIPNAVDAELTRLDTRVEELERALREIVDNCWVGERTPRCRWCGHKEGEHFIGCKFILAERALAGKKEK